MQMKLRRPGDMKFGEKTKRLSRKIIFITYLLPHNLREHNKLFDANKKTFRLGENKFAHWTVEEVAEKLNGHKEIPVPERSRTDYRGQMSEKVEVNSFV